MRPVKVMKSLRQFTVLVQRNLRLIVNDKLLLASLILQAPFMVLVIRLVADPYCFTSNLVNVGSRTALFILSAMAAALATAIETPRTAFAPALLLLSVPSACMSK